MNLRKEIVLTIFDDDFIKKIDNSYYSDVDIFVHAKDRPGCIKIFNFLRTVNDDFGLSIDISDKLIFSINETRINISLKRWSHITPLSITTLYVRS
jgi:hypothetical protein